MKQSIYVSLYIVFFMTMIHFLNSHEGHHHTDNLTAAMQPFQNEGVEPGSLTQWLGKIGRLHFLILHFPIALIIMTIVAEILNRWFDNPLFDHAARFMIVSAAIFLIPTVLLGLALSYGQNYEGLSLQLFQWHRYFGFITTGLTIYAAITRERYVRNKISSLSLYYFCLFFLFICVSLTGTFGGSLAFGIGS